ncbi:MAG TPA: hypothetical protein VGQ33_18380 [Vicinamibacteria bacterium]|nr:hypothetical protein [Vicinamibacteria bacterium]
MVRGWTGSAAVVALSLAGSAYAQDNLPPQEKYGLRLQYREFRPTLTGVAQKAMGEKAGTEVDVTDDLGLTDKRTFDLRATIQFKRGWKLRGSFTPFDYKGDVEATRAFTYGDTRYSRFDHVVSSVKGTYASADLEWDFLKGSHGFLGAVVGAKLFDVDTAIVDASINAREVDTITAPIPVIGLATRFYTGRVSFEGEIAGLSIGSRGSLLEAEASVRLHISERLAVMGGYRHLSLDGKDGLDEVDLKLGGWQFGLEISL